MPFFWKQPGKKHIDNIIQKEGIAPSSKIICIAPFQMISARISHGDNIKDKYVIYINTMAKIIDYLHITKEVEIIIICQCNFGMYDDRAVAKQICNLTSYKPKIFDNTRFTPPEIKGIIKRCEMIVSCKLHPSIFALSECVPTVTLYWHPKILGIISHFLNMYDYMIDIRSPIFDEILLKRINQCWDDRENIRDRLRQFLPIMKETSFLNIKLITEYLIRNRYNLNKQK